MATDFLRLVDEEYEARRGADRAERLASGGGGATSGGMDAWQQSVEARLASLDSRLGKIEPDLAALRTDTAVIKATMVTRDDAHQLERSLGATLQRYLGIAVSAMALITIVSTWGAKLLH